MKALQGSDFVCALASRWKSAMMAPSNPCLSRRRQRAQGVYSLEAGTRTSPGAHGAALEPQRGLSPRSCSVPCRGLAFRVTN